MSQPAKMTVAMRRERIAGNERFAPFQKCAEENNSIRWATLEVAMMNFKCYFFSRQRQIVCFSSCGEALQKMIAQ